jgi:hypothetical protein
MFAASKTDGSAVAPDAQFNYVTMLLHGDGTNGAQNNTFLDSSTNNFTITRNGNTTQGSFSPYGSNWSNFFDGSGDYLATSSTQIIPSSTTYTVEAWVYLTGDYSDYREIVTQGSSGNANRWLMFVNITDGILKIQTGSTSLTTSFTVPKNTWTHLAFVNNSGSYTIYANGTSVGSGTNTVTPQNTYVTVGAFQSGAEYFQGYISNVRITNTAVYTSAFTPSTTPLTAISGTSFLTCQSNRFIDNSANTYAITAYGNSSVQRFNPFGTSTAYSTSVIGGSGYFDGATDYLSVANATALQLSGNQFTIEGWFYLTVGSTDNNELVCQSSGSADSAVNYQIRVTASNKLRFLVMSGTSPTFIDSTVTITTNSWHHFACVCDGSGAGAFLRMWVNGVYQTASSSFNASGINTNTAATQIGAWTFSSQYVTGYITDLRILKGTALYTGTSNITVPTAPLTAITNTQLLTNYTNGAIFDNAMMNDLETVGNAQISTSVVKYGTGSLSFDGTGDYLQLKDTPNFIFGTGDFTIEGWIYLTSSGTFRHIYDQRPTSTDGAYPTLRMNESNAMEYVQGAAVRITSSTLSQSIWYHFALARSGTSTKLFINGTQSGSTYTDSTNYLCGTNRPFVGGSGYHVTTLSMNGYIDDLRITKGFARYTANFTAPTASFSDTGPY